MKKNLSQLTQTIGYEFKKKSYLKRALTHASYKSDEEDSNEKLEFLGDRVLGLVIAHSLYQECPSSREGHMALLFNTLVCQEACARAATFINLENFLYLGTSEKKVPIQKAILADACEALIGAVYLDGGFEAAQACVLKMWQEILTHILENEANITQDPKTLLQQWAQKNGYALPTYNVISCIGKAHEPIFTISVFIENVGSFQAEGTSKREAENKAALAFLTNLGIPCQP